MTRHEWKEDQPIYRQITEILLFQIMDGTFPEGEMLPSVRQIADDYGVSPLTAAKVVKELAKQNLTVKRRGIGSEVRSGARDRLVKRERKQFFETEWPALQVRLKRMDIDIAALLQELQASAGSDS